MVRLAMTTHSCHCEEQSDVAIYIPGGAELKMDCFAFGSQWRWEAAMTPIYVIARSKATWQSIFQVVQNLRWIASPSARNDGGDGSQWPLTLVIARSVATWQSIFQAVQDERWIASPSARNDGGRLQWLQFMSLRGAKRRGNLFSGGVGRKVLSGALSISILGLR